MKPWYSATEKETINFFDVDPSVGLSQHSVLARLEKFGANQDPQLNPQMESVYKVWVRRQGRTERVTLKHIVPGDIVFLEPGARVPADIRLLHVNNLAIDQSVLTGDALPAHKNTFAVSNKATINIQKNMAFAGSFVITGTGWGVVVACADKTTKNLQLPKKVYKKSHSANLLFRRLKRMGIIVNNKKVLQELPMVEVVFVDALLPDKDVHELIRKIQLDLGLSCVFCLPCNTVDRLKRELPGAQVYQGDKITGHVAKQILSMMVDTQFIAGASYENLLKVIGTMQQHGSKILWLSDGKNNSQVVGAATVSMIIGDISRDDNLYKADLIAPNFGAVIVSRILHNKK